MIASAAATAPIIGGASARERERPRERLLSRAPTHFPAAALFVKNDVFLFCNVERDKKGPSSLALIVRIIDGEGLASAR